jgi:hypothetical protein
MPRGKVLCVLSGLCGGIAIAGLVCGLLNVPLYGDDHVFVGICADGLEVFVYDVPDVAREMWRSYHDERSSVREPGESINVFLPVVVNSPMGFRAVQIPFVAPMAAVAVALGFFSLRHCRRRPPGTKQARVPSS